MKPKENIWKTGTIVLGIVSLILVAFFIYQAYNDKKIATDEFTICNKITGTPSWVDDSGTIIQSGYLDLNSLAVKEGLIPDRIHFYYSSYCGWCQKQIQNFGEDNWKLYQESGLTHDCYEIINSKNK